MRHFYLYKNYRHSVLRYHHVLFHLKSLFLSKNDVEKIRVFLNYLSMITFILSCILNYELKVLLISAGLSFPCSKSNGTTSDELTVSKESIFWGKDRELFAPLDLC